jgi:hypothetical protein
MEIAQSLGDWRYGNCRPVLGVALQICRDILEEALQICRFVFQKATIEWHYELALASKVQFMTPS